MFPLLQEAVEQNDGVVDGQGQLQHHGHRVGHEGDLAKDKVRPFVQQGRRHKGDQQHGHLRIRPGGEQQHRDDHNGGHHQNDPHFTVQRLRLGIAHIRGDLRVVGLQQIFHRGQGVLAGLVIVLPAEGDGDQGIRPFYVVLPGFMGGGWQGRLIVPLVRIPEVHRGDPIQIFDPVGQLPGRVIGHVGQQHPGGGEGFHLLLHHRQAPPGFCCSGKILRQIIAYRHPSLGDQAGNNSNDIEEKNQITFIHNKCG